MATPPTEIVNNITVFDRDDEMMIRSDLSIAALQGQWKAVVDMYETYKIARTILITGGRGTALHVAVNDGRGEVVKVLMKSIIEDHDVLRMKDERGDTPLHIAASRGFEDICKLIIGPNMEREHLITIKNKLGETPLFSAALTWQKRTFAYLLSVFRNYANSEANQTNSDASNLQLLMREDGDTILHSAIRREFFDLAVIIIHYCPQLHDIQNAKGFTPLKLLACTPYAFRSGSMWSWTRWRRIIYYCIEVKDLDVQRTMERYLNDESWDPHPGLNLPRNYHTCYEFFITLKAYAEDDEQHVKE